MFSFYSVLWVCTFPFPSRFSFCPFILFQNPHSSQGLRAVHPSPFIGRHGPLSLRVKPILCFDSSSQFIYQGLLREWKNKPPYFSKKNPLYALLRPRPVIFPLAVKSWDQVVTLVQPDIPICVLLRDAGSGEVPGEEKVTLRLDLSSPFYKLGTVLVLSLRTRSKPLLSMFGGWLGLCRVDVGVFLEIFFSYEDLWVVFFVKKGNHPPGASRLSFESNITCIIFLFLSTLLFLLFATCELLLSPRPSLLTLFLCAASSPPPS